MHTRKYKVHSINQIGVTVQAEYEGAPVEAVVQGLVVEGVPADGVGPSVTLEYIPVSMADALVEFAVGSDLDVTFEGSGAVAVAEPAPAEQE